MTLISRRDFIAGPLAVTGLAALAPRFLWSQEMADTASRTEKFLQAVADGEIASVKKLLAEDSALLAARDPAGRGAFTIARLSHHPEVGDLLRTRGYELDVHEAALAGDWERFEALAASDPPLVDQDHPVGGTAMYAAAVGGVGSAIWHVYPFSDGPNGSPRGREGFTPLRAALDFPDLARAEMTAAALLANGGDPNAPQAGRSSPLHAAAARGSIELTEMLLRKRARVEAEDGEGLTPLELAERAGHDSVVKLLRNHDAVPKDHSTSRAAYDVHGNPYKPVDLSAFARKIRYRVVGAAHFDFDTVRKIVDANPELAQSVASTTEKAVEACAHTGRKEIVDYLLEKGAPYSVMTAVMRGDTKRVKQLLAEDPLRIHERGPHDFALLWYPVIGRTPIELAELLIQSGARVEDQHHLGTTALHWAARTGDLDKAAFFIACGANVNRVGRKFQATGETPLQTALARGHDHVARLLRDRGAES